MTESQDFSLLQGLSKQDKSTIDTIYKVYFKMIQSLVIKNSGNEEDAKDIFQEAIVVLYQKSIDPEFVLSCQLSTYLYAVSKKLWIRKLEKLNRLYINIEAPDQADEKSIFSGEEADQLEKKFALMHQALEKLGEPCKSLIESFYIHKRHMQEIAEMYNYTNADNAKTQKYKCLMRLKKLFFAEYKN